MKVVLDTNVLVSGLMLPDSVPGRIVAAWRSAQFELAIPEPLLDEIGRVLSYPKTQGRLRWGQDEIARFLLLLRFKAGVVDMAGKKASVPSDPGDDPVLATLLAAGADCLVSGDGDLLALRDRFPIQTPAEFVRRLK